MNTTGDLWSPATDVGQTQAEYALLMAGIFLLTAAAVLAAGLPISALLEDAVNALG